MRTPLALLLVLTLSGCAVGYRKRNLTIVDNDGKPASGQTVEFRNIVPALTILPIRNATGVLDSNGSTTLRMPVTTGMLKLGDEGFGVLSLEEVKKGASTKRLYARPHLESIPELIQELAPLETKWHATLSKP